MKTPRALLLAALLSAGLAQPATALTFEPSSDGSIIRLNGPIENGDAEKFRQFLGPDYVARHGLRFGATLYLNSPGGSVVAGMELANAIREAGLMTHVSADSGCYSACTFVFLGGIRRTMLGKFGIHAMSKGRRAQSITIYSDQDFDAVQQLTSTLINLAQSLIGDSRMITAMLTVPGADIRLVPDKQLAEWRIITHASRPAQRMSASFDCGKSPLEDMEKVVCDHLVLADADRRMTAAYDWLSKKGGIENLESDQERWRAYRASCRNVLGPDRDVNVLACVREAYDVRVRQLEGLMTYHQASALAPAAKNWTAIPPLEEINTFRQQRQ